MSTNTTDPYVPALSRHIFTAGGCSSGTHNQPCFNESSDSFEETWDGYIYVPAPIENCVLKVSADDNASFYLHAFPDNVANLPGRGPLGGGNYESAESTPIEHLKKGYYRVHVTYQNIDYPKANIARLDVLLNGTQISIGQLETHNLLTSNATNILKKHYDFVNYEKTSSNIWALFDKTDINQEDDNQGDESEAEPGTVQWAMSGENSCATRLSMALSRSEYNLRKATGAYNVHLLSGTLTESTTPPVKWHNACLRPDGIHDETNTKTYSHFVPSADNLANFLKGELGAPDYSSLNRYLEECEVGNFSPDDIIIFHNPYRGERGWGHIGMGQSPDFREGDLYDDIDETNIWIIRRASWGEPKS